MKHKLIILIVSIILTGCGASERYSENYKAYGASIATCTQYDKITVTVPLENGKPPAVIEAPSGHCASIKKPDHELQYTAPLYGALGSAAINAGVIAYDSRQDRKAAETASRANVEIATQNRLREEALFDAFTNSSENTVNGFVTTNTNLTESYNSTIDSIVNSQSTAEPAETESTTGETPTE